MTDKDFPQAVPTGDGFESFRHKIKELTGQPEFILVSWDDPSKEEAEVFLHGSASSPVANAQRLEYFSNLLNPSLTSSVDTGLNINFSADWAVYFEQAVKSLQDSLVLLGIPSLMTSELVKHFKQKYETDLRNKDLKD